MSLLFTENVDIKEKASKAARAVVQEVCAVKKGEKVVIVTNPDPDTAQIGALLYEACVEAGASPVLLLQPTKTLLDTAEPAVLSALDSEPDVFFSISHNKLGKDARLIAEPIVMEDGSKYDSRFDYNLHGKKCMRAVWTPGITLDMFIRAALIDYAELENTCSQFESALDGAQKIHVESESGTNVTIDVVGRPVRKDDGNFRTAGSGGNIPAGEVFISPVVGKTQGIIAFDGSMSLKECDEIINDPIICTVENGFITKIEGKKEAEHLLKTITEAEETALKMEKEGALPKGMGELYKKNARNIGELGIGLNPAAIIGGNMLEDEKAFETCHFAVGANYDDDAPSLIHLDGVVKMPTITVIYNDGSSKVILDRGKICQ